MVRPFLILAALTLPAAAQDVDCATAITQVDLNACAYQEWKASDSRLNAVYKQAMALLVDWESQMPEADRGGVQALKEAQRAWITFRDKACEVEGFAVKGGSIEPLLVYNCMRLITEERVTHLKGMVEAYR